MPEFIADYTPKTDCSFTHGYFEAMEWLWGSRDDIEEAEVQGFSPEAIKTASEDCTAFLGDNAEDLETYCEISGRSMNAAGVDFYLSRNGHGAGFFDHGNEPVFDRLQAKAREYGTQDAYLGEDGFFYVA